MLSQLPPEVITDLPKITLMGNQEIIIENHKGLISYEERLVKINTNLSPLLIEGKDLVIEKIDGEAVIIIGKIVSIRYFSEPADRRSD